MGVFDWIKIIAYNKLTYLMSEMIAPFVDIGGIGENHYLIKAYILKVLHTTTFWNNLHQVHSISKYNYLFIII